MTSFIPMFQQMIIGNMVGRNAIPHISFAKMALRSLSCILLLAGLFLAVYAEYIWLGVFLPLYLAALITSITLISLSVVLGYMSGTFKTQPSSSSNTAQLDITPLLTDILSLLDDDIEDAVRNHPKIAVAISTLSGFMAGKKMNS
jgi:uncharacterized membrane protein (DUF485 family)